MVAPDMTEHSANPNLGPVRARLATIRSGGGSRRFVGSPSFYGAVFLMLVGFAVASLTTVLFPSPVTTAVVGVVWLAGAGVTWGVQRRHWQALRRQYLALETPMAEPSA